MEITTKQLSLEQIEKIVEDNKPDEFIGAIETSCFEFRKKAYLVEDKSGVDWVKYKARIELLKDFSSISNSGGGYIFIGLLPDTIKGKRVEYVEKISAVETDTIDIDKWLDILSDGLIPRFPRDKIKYGYIGKNSEVFWILIPNAKDLGHYPYIILQDQWNPQETIVLKGQVYGIYTRDGAKNIQLVDPHKFQEYISGALSGQISIVGIEAQINRLSGVVDKIENNQTKSSTQPPTSEQKKRIIEEIVNKLDPDYDDFYMIASPVRGVEIKKFWDNSDKSLYHHLKNPPILRQMGWDLSVWITEYPQPEGDSWEIMNGNRKILKVSKNGIVAAGANIQEFLDWGLRDEEKNNNKKLLNAFAFVEYVNSFFLFMKALVNNGIIEKGELSYKIEIGFITKDGGKYSLVFTINNLFPTTHGPQKKEVWQFGPYKTEELISSEKISGSIVQDIYASGFGYIPDFTHDESYLQKIGGEVVVDEGLYKKQK